MAKRFIDTGRYRQAWRKLDPKFRAAYGWLVENCDAAGFWIIDLEHFKFECGYTLDLDRFIREIGGAVMRHGPEKLVLVDFIEVNYGKLREGYNPHKPAIRALENAKLGPSLNQASTKLEEEDEEEDEDTSSGKEHGRVSDGYTPPTPEPQPPKDPRFEKLWIAYERSGSKGKALAYWHKLPEEDRAAVEAKVEAYVKSTPDGEFRLNLEGWINPAERRWERPIRKPKGSGMSAALHSADVPPEAYSEQ